MIYIVNESERIITFPDAVFAKPSGAAGTVIHIIGTDDSVIGNFPIRSVKYYGPQLPPFYQKKYEEQQRWESMTREEQDLEKKYERERKRKQTGEGGGLGE